MKEYRRNVQHQPSWLMRISERMATDLRSSEVAGFWKRSEKSCWGSTFLPYLTSAAPTPRVCLVIVTVRTVRKCIATIQTWRFAPGLHQTIPTLRDACGLVVYQSSGLRLWGEGESDIYWRGGINVVKWLQAVSCFLMLFYFETQWSSCWHQWKKQNKTRWHIFKRVFFFFFIDWSTHPVSRWMNKIMSGHWLIE